MEYRQKLQELGINADKSGKYICPKCSATRKNKSDKCLSVTYGNDAVLYNCHHCGWKGSVFYRYNNYKKQYKRPEPPKTISNKEKMYKYLANRGITKTTADKYKIDFNGNELIFPYYKNGDLVNVKYRTFDKKFRQEAETEKTFFGMDQVTNFDQLVICEGEIDVLSFAEVGIEAVSVPQGASENKLECIDNCWNWLDQFKNFVIAADNDEAGDKLKNNLLQRLDKNKCKIAYYGQFKDANEVLNNDATKVKDIVDLADFLPPEGVITFYDCIDEILEFKENGYTKGYSTGWASLDEKFTIKTGNLMIVTGYPSRGKSFFTDNLLYNLSKTYGLKHLIASFENTDANHFARFASMDCEQKFNTIDGEQFQETFQFIAEHFYRIKVDRLWTVDQIIDACEQAVRKYGVKTLTIDPYNRLDNDYKDREDKYIGNILAKLSLAAKQLDILIIFIAHPKKPDGDNMPTMYSISGSSDWYNMADYGIIIHRERDSITKKLEMRSQITVAKVKDWNLGDPSGGEVYLDFIPDKYKLIDCSKKW